MSEMVERASEAVFDIIWPLQDWDGNERICRSAARVAARAVLQSMREPDAAMLDADPFKGLSIGDGIAPYGLPVGEIVWKAMLTAALEGAGDHG